MIRRRCEKVSLRESPTKQIRQVRQTVTTAGRSGVVKAPRTRPVLRQHVSNLGLAMTSSSADHVNHHDRCEMSFLPKS